MILIECKNCQCNINGECFRLPPVPFRSGSILYLKRPNIGNDDNRGCFDGIPFTNTSKYIRLYGMSLKNIAKKYGGKQTRYYYMHTQGRLSEFLASPKKYKCNSKYVRLYGISRKDMTLKFDISYSKIYELHTMGRLADYLKEQIEIRKILSESDNDKQNH